jgi:hypothetical protein
MNKRYRVDLEYGGYVSYAEENYDKALQLYEERGIRLRECKNIFDEGHVLFGEMIVEDLTRDKNTIN